MHEPTLSPSLSNNEPMLGLIVLLKFDANSVYHLPWIDSSNDVSSLTPHACILSLRSLHPEEPRCTKCQTGEWKSRLRLVGDNDKTFAKANMSKSKDSNADAPLTKRARKRKKAVAKDGLVFSDDASQGEVGAAGDRF